MPHPFPHHYESSLSWQSDRQGLIRSGKSPELIGGPPPQFDGKEEYWSPETLLLSSVQLCLMTTFLAIAEKAHLELKSYQSRIFGTLDKGTDGIRFSSIELEIKLEASDLPKAQELLLKAKKYCIVSNTLNVPVAVRFAQ